MTANHMLCSQFKPTLTLHHFPISFTIKILVKSWARWVWCTLNTWILEICTNMDSLDSSSCILAESQMVEISVFGIFYCKCVTHWWVYLMKIYSETRYFWFQIWNLVPKCLTQFMLETAFWFSSRCSCRVTINRVMCVRKALGCTWLKPSKDICATTQHLKYIGCSRFFFSSEWYLEQRCNTVYDSCRY